MFLCLTTEAAPAPGAPMSAQVDRSLWPAALQTVPLDRLSSGALMLLDRNGDLVRAPAPSEARALAAATVALDLRVAPNLRLGDDPAPLPPERLAAEIALRLRYRPEELQSLLEVSSLPARFAALIGRMMEWQKRVEFLEPFRPGEIDGVRN